MSVLECVKLDAGYSKGIPCLRGIDLTLDPGQITCLLGPNGAGKTTLLMALSGLLPRAAGEVRVDGHAVASGNPRQAVRSGMVLVPDDRALFRLLSTEQNLKLAVRERAGRRAALDTVLDRFPSLRRRLKVDAGRLSGGEQQMLAIGRAILQHPKVLLIDELSMGLAPVIVDEIREVLVALARDEGMAVVLVEQHVHLALAADDRASVLVHGRVVDQDDVSAFRADPQRIERAYLGGGQTTETTGEDAARRHDADRSEQSAHWVGDADLRLE